MLRAIFVVIGIALALVGPLFYAGPQLASDLMVGQKWSLALDLSIKESKCTRWYYLVSTCHIEYVNRQDPARVGGSLNYFVFGSWSGERALLLRSTENPGRIGTTLGIEHMRQRLATFGIFVVFALGTLAAMLTRLLRNAGEPAAFVPQRTSSAPAAAGGTFGRPAGPTT